MRIVVMGTGLFAEPTFEALLAGDERVVGLVTQPDREKGDERGSTRQTGVGMKTLAERHRVPVFQPESVNTPDGVEGLRAFNPELLVVAAYGQILSNEVLNVAPMGGINVHASLLPKYRGAAPIAWAIWKGETRTGVTIIRMSTALDAGEMLAQETTDVGPDETAGEVEARLAPVGARLACEIVARMKAGPIAGTKQDSAQVTKAPKLKKEHGAIDWTRPAVEVCNHLRAMQPWPTAYTYWHRPGQQPLRLIVCKAAPRLASEDERAASPGDVLVQADPTRLVVRAGDEAVEVLDLQPAGKRRMPASDFLRGHRAEAGGKLGPA